MLFSSMPCATQCMQRPLTPCLSIKVGLGGGSVRINVFPDASTRLPKLDLELFHFFGRVNMYINLVPRANLARPPPGPTPLGGTAYS